MNESIAPIFQGSARTFQGSGPWFDGTRGTQAEHTIAANQNFHC